MRRSKIQLLFLECAIRMVERSGSFGMKSDQIHLVKRSYYIAWGPSYTKAATRIILLVILVSFARGGINRRVTYQVIFCHVV